MPTVCLSLPFPPLTSHATPLLELNGGMSFPWCHRPHLWAGAQHGEGWWSGYEVGQVAELGKEQGEEACAEWPGSWALGGEGLWGDAEGCRKRDTDGHREGALGGACSALPPLAFLCPTPFPPLCLGGSPNRSTRMVGPVLESVSTAQPCCPLLHYRAVGIG